MSLNYQQSAKMGGVIQPLAYLRTSMIRLLGNAPSGVF